MTIHQFTAADRKPINWASGTSTEIFIHPSNGSFSERNFVFRISTATVEAEESTFTFFEGIARHLMILKGELELIHEGRYTKHLAPYDQDVFSGEWSTRSKGKVTDFNLMLKGGATGSLSHQRIEQDHSARFTATTDFYFIYVASGTARFNSDGTASTGDLLQISNGSDITIQAKETCDVIVIEVMSGNRG
ncbi:MAG TPA: HutD family protein [Flavipsychrobacter sp.]|jgi:environmental stress-induced protein Ves|nr:HutD family protein [Flavipsychrobacter sp.]